MKRLSRRIFMGSGLVFLGVFLSAVGSASLSTQAVAAAAAPRVTPQLVGAGGHSDCLSLLVELRGNNVPVERCLVPRNSASALIDPPRAQRCNDQMQAPWVALYRDIDFGGGDICFLGTGRVNLARYGWADTASSINIGANGVFTSRRGARFGFSYGLRNSDLRSVNWNDRIYYIRIDG